MLEIGFKIINIKVLLVQTVVTIKNPRPVMRKVICLC